MKKVTRTCANTLCRKVFFADPYEAAHGRALFCSKACAATIREKKQQQEGKRKAKRKRTLYFPEDFIPESGDILARLRFHEMCHAHHDPDHDPNKE
ncbi:MAG: hypothetical protein E6R03_11675 [Hyphomicrobiaceae bacterium]|nr:MAG: hypothetical protein E6R03_11675 [Hyphomicrobiaceae bacterium]